MKQPGWKVMLSLPYLLTALFILAAISGSMALMLSSVHRYVYHQMEAESYRIAESYADSLKSSLEAVDIINRLLEEKLLAASIAAAGLHDEFSTEKLAELAESMAVDVIYVYDANGVLTDSNTGQYIGWTAKPGHPVYDFMVGGEKSLIEHIRPDSESGISFKFGYYRLNDGCFVQIGVLADAVDAFRSGFETQHMLDRIVSEHFVKFACFMAPYNQLAAGSGYRQEDAQTLEAQIKASLAAGETVKTVSLNGERYLQVAVPIGTDLKHPGTLILGSRVDDTEAQVRQMSILGVSALAVVFTLLLILVHSSLRKSRRLGYLAYHDSLTELPNKRAFERDYLNKVSDTGVKSTVLVLKLESLSSYSMMFGYHHTERLVQLVAAALSELSGSCAAENSLYCLSPERFAVLLKGYQQKDDLFRLGDYVIAELKKTLSMRPVGLHIGIVEAAGQEEPETVLDKATMAAEQIKSHDNFGYCFYNCDMAERLLRSEQIEEELRAALGGSAASEVYLEYQPIVDARNLKIIAFEALVRLRTERHGAVAPMEFIPLAEQRMMMPALGDLILQQACVFLAELLRRGLDRVKVAVNISGIQLLRPEFPDAVLELLRSYGLRESSLILEVTETILLENFDMINAHLEKLQQSGIAIELDDFGTGYSSLSRLRDMHVDAVKIDQSFICKILKMEHSRLIISEIISMSHKVGYQVIAEGIEAVEQKEYLEENGCDYLQGYLFGRPMSRETALALLEQS